MVISSAGVYRKLQECCDPIDLGNERVDKHSNRPISISDRPISHFVSKNPGKCV
jgi:hypothetical protein